MKQHQQQINIDLSQCQDVVCESCKGYFFLSGFSIKRISALMSPTGKEMIVQVPYLICFNCGQILIVANEPQLQPQSPQPSVH